MCSSCKAEENIQNRNMRRCGTLSFKLAFLFCFYFLFIFFCPDGETYQKGSPDQVPAEDVNVPPFVENDDFSRLWRKKEAG